MKKIVMDRLHKSIKKVPSEILLKNPTLQITGRKRSKDSSHEQYFLLPDVLDHILLIVKETLWDQNFHTVIDPCCGDATSKDLLEKHFPDSRFV